MPPDVVLEVTTNPESFRKWFLDVHDKVPERLKPSLNDLEPFSYLFCTYVLNSFDIVPGQALQEFAPLPYIGESWLRPLPQLRPRRVDSAGKAHAKQAKLDALRKLASEHAIPIHETSLRAFLQEPSRREQLSLVAYGFDLLGRLDGHQRPGSASLALWRGFAWTATGAPIHDFELTAEAILAAYASLVQDLNTLAQPGQS